MTRKILLNESILPKNTRLLREIMRKNGLNCRGVAKIMDIHVITVRNWHRGKPAPQDRKLEDLTLRLKNA